MATRTASPTNSTEEGTPPPSLRYYSDTTEGSTFESPKLRQWTESHLEGAERILNPCAGTARLDVDGEVLRVDLNEDADADLHIDFRDLLDHVEPGSFDAVVYDPPYSYNQAVTKYGIDIDRDDFYFYKEAVMELFDTLLAPGGTFIQFGYTTAAMPCAYGYELLGVGLFNKLGSQNDYLGTALTKPSSKRAESKPVTVEKAVRPNAGASQISGSNVTAGGNGGAPIEMRYQRCASDTEYTRALSNAVNRWVGDTDRILHIYETAPTVTTQGRDVTRCAYRCIDLHCPDGPHSADVVETPWNIGATFATGAFDVVVLDLPYSAFQQNIRTPWKEAADGGDHTHVATALKRSITDLVAGDGGRVIQVGRTATLMSGIDYDYRRYGVGIVQHPSRSTDRIVVVDEKPHENLETIGLPDGEVDRYGMSHIISGQTGATGTTSKHSRTEPRPTDAAHFCSHCGNHFYYHPALYVSCMDCGARPGNYCVDGRGKVLHGTIHDLRLDTAEERHDGTCNNKEPTYLRADADRVEEVVAEVRDLSNALDSPLAEHHIRQVIKSQYAAVPRSTDIVEQVVARLRAPVDEQVVEQPPVSNTTKGTSLSDYI